MSENHKAKAEAWQAVKLPLFSASAGLIQVVSFELLSKALKLPYWGSYLAAALGCYRVPRVTLVIGGLLWRLGRERRQR